MIRKLLPGDKADYIRMAKAFYASDAVAADIPEKHIADTFEELMRSEEYAACLVSEENGVLDGYALLAFTWSQEGGGRATWIEELYIEPHARGGGKGSRLLTCILNNYPSMRFRLETEPENTGANRLYKRFGFEELPYSQLVRDRKNVDRNI